MYKIIIILIGSVFYSTSISPQGNDPIEDLYQYNPWVVTLALEVIEEEELEEAVPVIVDLIEEKQPIIQLKFLETLLFFSFPEIIELSIDLINRADAFADSIPPFDPLEAKVITTSILFTQEEYSTVDYVFELYDRDKPQINQSAFNLLPIIALNIPGYAFQAKNELIYAYENNVDTKYRSLALSFLVNIYGYEMLDRIIELLNNSNKLSDKRQAYNLISRLNYSGLNLFLKERLSVEQEWTLRVLIADSLLIKFGEPSDLKAVIDHLPFENHSTTNYIISTEIENFIPPRPTVPTSEMITNLIGYTDELYRYGWITEVSVYNQYLDYLKDIEKAYSNKDKELLCEKLDEYLDYTEGLHRSLLTEEGYKFMHYHGTYIKENVEDEFGECE